VGALKVWRLGGRLGESRELGSMWELGSGCCVELPQTYAQTGLEPYLTAPARASADSCPSVMGKRVCSKTVWAGAPCRFSSLKEALTRCDCSSRSLNAEARVGVKLHPASNKAIPALRLRANPRCTSQSFLDRPGPDGTTERGRRRGWETALMAPACVTSFCPVRRL